MIDLDIGLNKSDVIDALVKTQKSNGMENNAHARLMITRGPKKRPFQHPALSQDGATIVIIMEHSIPKIPRPISLATVPHLRGLPMTQDPKLVLNTDKHFKPRGSIIIFPSHLWHRVKPVTKGTRYSLVIWALGKPFK